MTSTSRACLAVLATALLAACTSSDPGDATIDAPSATPATTDPGTGPWELVPPDRVAEECHLDPELLRAADEALNQPWAVVRYGKLCHEFYPEGSDEPAQVFSLTKTLGAVVTGAAAYETRDLERTKRKTGPLSDEDRVDHWLDEFSFNPDAQIAHVLGMVAFNEDLNYGAKIHVYDALGDREINRLSDVINTAIAQDPDRLGANIEQFTQRFIFQKLGMRDSVWTGGDPDKNFAYTWITTIRDMARIGLLILNRGVWNGERVLDAQWTYRMTHPSFEDANTGYGYLTWVTAHSNFHYGSGEDEEKFQEPRDFCSPAAINASFPHGISAATDCNYAPPATCEQEFDVGVWSASGLGGQYIEGHAGLDMVLVVKDEDQSDSSLWKAVIAAVVAEDPRFAGDQEAFCAAYSAGSYAPDLP